MRTELEQRLRALARTERRRRRRHLASAGLAALSMAALVLVTLEADVDPASGWRVVGYVVVAGVLAIAAGAGTRAWIRALPSAGAVAERLERLFPQLRGAVRDAANGWGGVGLAADRRETARRWVERRGEERLDHALAEANRRSTARWSGLAAGLAVLAVGMAASHPTASRRLAAVIVAPGSLFAGAERWRVEPGDADVAYGGALDGRVAYDGPPRDGGLVVAWRNPGGGWREAPVSEGPAGTWRWEDLTADREYRFRYGGAISPVHRIEVGTPFAVTRLEARQAGAEWTPLPGRVVVADRDLEIRGRASEPVVRAGVRVGGVEASGTAADLAHALAFRGRDFEGRVRLPAGTARVEIATSDGRAMASASFVVAAARGPFVSLVEPADDPVRLVSDAAWLVVRAGADRGLDAVAWETDRGGGGSLGIPDEARDTTLVGAAHLGRGAAPGDTVRYRAIAVDVDGGRGVTAWHRAIVPSVAALRAAAAEERAAASRALDRALGAVREEGGLGPAPSRNGAEEGAGLERAADSLAVALERTLADPDLPPELAERLDRYRELMAPRDGRAAAPVGSDPAAEIRARADLLEAVQKALDEVEETLALQAAADSLARLAEGERGLADETRGARGRDLTESRERQRSLDRAAREAAADAPEAAERRVADALDRAREALESDDPGRAADAQEAAAVAMERAADQASEEARRRAGDTAAKRAALERAGAETLFLAERQRAVIERLERPGADVDPEIAARQDVVTRGLDRALGTLVEAVGGIPAGAETAEALARATFAVRSAEAALARDTPFGASTRRREALEEAAGALTTLARAFLVPEGAGGGPGGAGSEGASGALARRMQNLAGAQRAVADAMARGEEAAGGNPEAAAAEREIGDRLGELGGDLGEAGVDPRAIEALAREVEEAATRLEQGLAGARTESDLRTLSRRFGDLGRMLDRTERERRTAETARSFVPSEPPPLPVRATAPRLDADRAMASWANLLSRESVDRARAYLERLADEGVRQAGEAP